MFKREFDAHIYYTAESRDLAFAMRERAFRDFAGLPVFISRMTDRPVGPHLLPMFEIQFSKELAETIVPWIKKERADLTVLLHEVTGDDPKDHSEGAEWLGPRLDLDFSKLDPSPTP